MLEGICVCILREAYRSFDECFHSVCRSLSNVHCAVNISVYGLSKITFTSIVIHRDKFDLFYRDLSSGRKLTNDIKVYSSDRINETIE